jgi:hypothetical protein
MPVIAPPVCTCRACGRSGCFGEQIDRRRTIQQFEAHRAKPATDRQSEKLRIEGCRAVQVVDIDVDE